MNPEIETYSRYIQKQISTILASVERLSEAQLNQAPAIAGANSAYVIAAHVLGNARAWVLGIACGQPLRRDRPGEFASSGSYETLANQADALSAEIQSALQSLDPARLDQGLIPSQELWGEGDAEEISVREAFAHVLEHASMHLGQIQLTRDLVSQDPPR